MSTISIRLPESLHAKLRACASRDGTSINQFVALAVAEKFCRLETEAFLRGQAARGASRNEYLQLLAKAPDVEPEEPEDRLPQRTRPE